MNLSLRNNKIKYPLLISFTLFHINPVVAEEEESAQPAQEEEYDVISVTASRVERRTQDVAGSIDVIDSARIENEKMFNIKDAIEGSPGVLINSKNSAYDSRLIIRGAGQKANYGVREIMVIRDGVPMTDPDSFSRFDFIDTQDIERIEITKGPGSLFGAGSAGGTIQIISKSVFDTDSNRIKLGAGQFGQGNLHGRLAGDIDESNAFSLTASYRKTDNDWRDWNEFESKQLAFKHGYLLDNGATLESELSYHEADLQLPGSMDESEFERYLDSGEQKDTSSSPWQHSGRYSTIWFFNSRYEQEMDDLTFKPRIYANRWDHYHPVTGAINDNPGTTVVGTDLELAYRHRLWGPSTLVAGVTARRDDTEGAKKFTYADVETSPPPPWNPMGPETILRTNSDEAGDLLEEEDATNTLYGLFVQETLQPNQRTVVDIGFRYDRNNFDIDNTAFGEYSYGAGSYTFFDALEITNTDKTFNLFSPKLGITYELNNLLNLYGVVAQSGQVPSESEIQSNPKLDAAKARNVEVGLKGRAQAWSFGFALYRTTVSDEIVSVLNENLTTEFQNAGETLKKGMELSGRYDLNRHFWVEGSFAYSDYSFSDFVELVRTGPTQTPIDRSGNQLPFIPRQQYGLSLGYSHPSGFKAVLRSNSWGSYYVDNANTEQYGGYDFVTNLLLSYQSGPHHISLNVENLFDKLYALEVKKSTSGDKTYAAASPRNAMLSYSYNF
ncbi:MAG: TonB-dependent receptor [Candidatus Thiodiazotropha sp. (ex Ctena orbiculata)]|nr:TonB-dependent receptor [Candidatus Thiodiazotropha taylori]MBT2996721.1 TonB-dependent receptor [Candidatus Thiodiazotropha taylori]MBV2106155.1 TonB-dependent receptor [Candidatus Thiodiazotropha taylori]MBV2109912.1 TonB-dependent receptor [Candidatus Thiodiazotropha taylori]